MWSLSFVELSALINSVWWPFLRILAVFTASPLFGDRAFSLQARILLSMSLAVLVAPIAPSATVINPLSLSAVIVAAEQIVWGVLFGTILHAMIGVLATLGQIVSMQMGLAMAIMNDPSNGISIPILGRVFMIIALLIFIALDGHLVMISLLVESFRVWPPGTVISDISLNITIASLGWMLAGALALALPAVTAMLLSNFAFGIMNRAAPSFNIFALGFPMTMLLGLVALLLAIKGLPGHYANYITEAMQLLRAMIRGEA